MIQSPCRISRRQAVCVMAGLSLLAAKSLQGEEAKRWSLAPQSFASERVECRIEVQGELKLINSVDTPAEALLDAEKQQVTRLPLQVQAKVRYSEVVAPDARPNVLRASVRHYEVAEADMRVGQGAIRQELSSDKRNIVVHQERDTHSLRAMDDVLTREELELIDLPGDAAVWPALLPPKAVALGETWRPAAAELAQLLRWEVVTDSSVELALERVEDQVAHLTLAGKLTGGVEGVSTTATLEGKLQCDLTRRRFTWLAVKVQENRAASQGIPGFETTSRIRMSLTESREAATLIGGDAAAIVQESSRGANVLRYRNAAGTFEFLYDPAWRVVTNQAELTVLRYLKGGEVLAQCNLSPLPTLGRGEQLTLEGFQAHLRQSLKNSLGDVTEAGEEVNDQGVRVLRVVATGLLEETPLQWHLYHLSNDSGDRVSMAVTVNAEQVERYGGAEESLLRSFTFLAPSVKAAQAKRPTTPPQ